MPSMKKIMAISVIGIVLGCGGSSNAVSILPTEEFACSPKKAAISGTIGCSYGATYYFEFSENRKPPQDPAVFREIKLMGAGWSRIDLNKVTSDARGSDSIKTMARPFANRAFEQGMGLIMVLSAWGQPPKTPAEFEAWKEFVRKCVTEFQTESANGQIVWNVWNEPNNDSWGTRIYFEDADSVWINRAKEYMAVLDATVEAIRSVDPNAVISAPVMGWGTEKIKLFFEECKRLDIEKKVDFIDIHPDKIGAAIPGGPHPKQDPESIWGRDKTFPFVSRWKNTLLCLDDLFSLFPSMKFIVSEWPYGARKHIDDRSTLTAEQNQAAQSLRAYLISLSEPVALHVQWEFQEEIAPLDEDERGYFIDVGIRRISGEPREVYGVMQKFLADYKGWKAISKPESVSGSRIIIDAPGAYRLYIQSPDGSEEKVIKWGVAGNSSSYPEMPEVS